MSKKRKNMDFIGDIQDAMEMAAIYTRGLTFRAKSRILMSLAVDNPILNNTF